MIYIVNDIKQISCSIMFYTVLPKLKKNIIFVKKGHHHF